MNRRQYLAGLGVALLAGCASPDGSTDRDGGPPDRPVLAFGESHVTTAGVEVSCEGVEWSESIEIDGETHAPPDDDHWALVEFRAENTTEESVELPWRQGLAVEVDDRRFGHEVNDTPVSFLFWDEAYRGGEEVDPGVAESGIVPIAVDPEYADREAAVLLPPGVADVETTIRWTGE